MLKEGTVAPDFTLPDQSDSSHTLSRELGKRTLVYFYPKDDTSGCTKEACDIRDSYAEFGATGIKVFGISGDSVKSHRQFAEKYELPFTLLADPERSVIAAYGAENEGKTKRISYLLDSEGKIIKAYPNVDPTLHAEMILKDAAS